MRGISEFSLLAGATISEPRGRKGGQTPPAGRGNFLDRSNAQSELGLRLWMRRLRSRNRIVVSNRRRRKTVWFGV